MVFDGIAEFKTLWDIVLKERETGYEHRKPKKRNKRKPVVNMTDIDPVFKSMMEEMEDEEYDEMFEREKKANKKKSAGLIFKVRTESFAED